MDFNNMNLTESCSYCLLYILFVFVTFREADSSSLATEHAANNSSNLPESREKRSDCLSSGQTGEWHIDCACCHPKCTAESFREAFSSVCTKGQPCYLSNKHAASWSSFYQEDTFLSAHCSPSKGCGDGMGDYSCTCLRGFVVLDCDLKVILPATIVPVVALVLLVLAAFLAYRWYKRRNKQVSPAENHHAAANADSMPSNTMYKNRVLLQ